MMNKRLSFLFTFFLLLTTLFIAAQMTPEEVVQKQLENYNNRDIEGFMSVIDTDITVHDFSTGKITITGFEACKNFYTTLFDASPNLHSTILTRTIFANKVIDHERITGRNGINEIIELVLIYEVKNDKIIKISVLK